VSQPPRKGRLCEAPPSMGNVQYAAPVSEVKLDWPSITQLCRVKAGSRIVFKQVMPLRPTGDDHYTKRGSNPHYTGYYSTMLKRITQTFVEPSEVELVDFLGAHARFAAPVIDVSRNFVVIPHTSRRCCTTFTENQLYLVTIHRQGDSIFADVVLDPLETSAISHGCFTSDLQCYDDFMIHYRESSWVLDTGEVIYALGVQTKKMKRVALQVAPFVPCEVPYDLFVGIDLRNGSKYSVTSVEHNMGIYKAQAPLKDAPFVAKSILAHIRITEFPADGTSLSEGGKGEAAVTKLDDTPVNADAAEVNAKIVPAIAKLETGVIAKTKQAIVEAEGKGSPLFE